MELKEMFTLVNLLDKRVADYRKKVDERKQKMLSNPTDKELESGFYLIHEWEKEIDKLHSVRLQLKFDIEDITGEEVDESVWSY